MAATQSVTTIELERGGTGTGSWLKGGDSAANRPSPMVVQRAQPASGNAGRCLVWRPFSPGSEVATVRGRCRVPRPSGWLMAACLSRMVDRVLVMRRTHGLLIDACHARWNLVSNGHDRG